MGILWLLVPIFSIASFLFWPLVISVCVSIPAMKKEATAKPMKLVVLLALIGFGVYINLKHPKDYPALCLILELLTMCFYYFIYLKMVEIGAFYAFVFGRPVKEEKK